MEPIKKVTYLLGNGRYFNFPGIWTCRSTTFSSLIFSLDDWERGHERGDGYDTIIITVSLVLFGVKVTLNFLFIQIRLLMDCVRVGRSGQLVRWWSKWIRGRLGLKRQTYCSNLICFNNFDGTPKVGSVTLGSLGVKISGTNRLCKCSYWYVVILNF